MIQHSKSHLKGNNYSLKWPELFLLINHKTFEYLLHWMFFYKPYNKNLPKFDIEGKNSMLTKGLSPNGGYTRWLLFWYRLIIIYSIAFRKNMFTCKKKFKIQITSPIIIQSCKKKSFLPWFKCKTWFLLYTSTFFSP